MRYFVSVAVTEVNLFTSFAQSVTAGECETSEDDFNLLMRSSDKLVTLFPIIIQSSVVCGEREAD